MKHEKIPFIIKIEPDYASFKASGLMDKERAVELLEAMAEVLKMNQHIARCVVDFRDADLKMNELDRFEMAKMSVEVLGNRKLATVAKMESVPNKLYENATNNRGLENFVTGDMDMALQWLLK